MADLVVIGNTGRGRVMVPAISAGEKKGPRTRFLEFFTVNIRNPNTRAAYSRAAVEFLRWCEGAGIGALDQVQPVHVAAYVEQLGRRMWPALGQAAARLHPYAVRLASFSFGQRSPIKIVVLADGPVRRV